MGSQAMPDEGPDLSRGVEESILLEKGSLLGRVGDEAVLLIATDGRIYAVSAHCPHYGAPLSEGKVHQGRIVCPWHHASFDLETGAGSAPALNALPCWEVEREGGLIFVRKPKKRAERPRARKDERRIVIVGAGAAGAFAAEALRERGFEGEVVMLTKEDDGPYDKPNLSKDYLAGNAPEEWIPLRSKETYAELGVDLRLCSEVAALDTAKKTVRLASGEALAYDACLIATGAAPISLPVPGADLPHVHYLRTLRDCRRIIAAAEKASLAVVIGSGFIGLEVAQSLRARGIDVFVVSRDSVPLERSLGKELGSFLLDLHQKNGVKFALQSQVDRIDPDGVVLEGGRKLPADFVVVGIGVRPDLALAEKADLTLGGGGIAVDQYLTTSDPHVFAAGDLAYWPEPRSGQRVRIEHWVVAGRQGQVAAANMLGGKEPFTVVPFFWTSQYDAAISYIGCAPQWDEIRIRGNIAARDAILGYIRGGRVLAVATIGRDGASLEAERAMSQGDEKALLALLDQG